MVLFPLLGHHETPLSASTKMLERFPNNLPKHRGNVIPADSEKKSFEEVSGEENRFQLAVLCVGGEGLGLAFELAVYSSGKRKAGESMVNPKLLRTDGGRRWR